GRTVGPVFSLFFFQAEDGIRDFHVTGVQTCALPISFPPIWNSAAVKTFLSTSSPAMFTQRRIMRSTLQTDAACQAWEPLFRLCRSEERRVGKELRCGRSTAP